MRTGAATEWRRGEIVAQVLATRDQPAVDGEVHFSMEAFLTDRDSVGTILRRTVYAQPALVPESPWMMAGDPAAPRAVFKRTAAGDSLLLSPGSAEPVRWWLIQLRNSGSWATHVIDGSVRGLAIPPGVDPASTPDLVTVTAVDRVGRTSAVSALRLP